MLLLSVVALIGCSKTDSESAIALSDKVCSFPYEGGSVTVTVAADGSWSYQTSSDWIQVERNNNQLIITAESNSGRDERSAEISVISGSIADVITIYQLGDPNMPVIFRQGPRVFSRECNYSAGVFSDVDEAGNVSIYVGLLNLRTDERRNYGPYPEATYPLGGVSAVADNGDCYIEASSGKGTYFFDHTDGRITMIDNNSLVFSCSSDGTIAVGARYAEEPIDEEGHMPYLPYKWVNGVAQRLPMPDTPYRESNAWYGGLIPRQISGDGKIIYGTEWQGMDDYMIWWDENDNWHYVGDDIRQIDYLEVTDGNGNTGTLILAKGMVTQNNPYAMTPSGKWITGWYTEHTVNETTNAVSWDFYPGFYNREENKTYIFRDYPDGRGIAVREDGIGFIRTNSAPYQTDSSMSEYYAVDIESGSVINTIQNWFYDNYGIYTPAKEWLMGFSSDFKVAFFATKYVVDKR